MLMGYSLKINFITGIALKETCGDVTIIVWDTQLITEIFQQELKKQNKVFYVAFNENKYINADNPGKRFF